MDKIFYILQIKLGIFIFGHGATFILEKGIEPLIESAVPSVAETFGNSFLGHLKVCLRRSAVKYYLNP